MIMVIINNYNVQYNIWIHMMLVLKKNLHCNRKLGLFSTDRDTFGGSWFVLQA